MAIITLTSDWGTKDHYIGSVKGSILRQMPEAVIVDISHQVASYDLNQAAFIIRSSFRDFPDGTVHIIGINSDASKTTPHTAVFAEKQYFISADNGIFTLLFDHQPDAIVEIVIPADSSYFTFSARDVFAKAAVHLAKGKPIEELGPAKSAFSTNRIPFRPITENNNTIKGQIIYIDAYENLITNITSSLFKETGKNRRFTIYLRNSHYRLNELKLAYSDVKIEGEIVALFGSSGFLEIALNRAPASSLLGLEVNDPVRIEFED